MKVTISAMMIANLSNRLKEEVLTANCEVVMPAQSKIRREIFTALGIKMKKIK
jgi:hypothetical protein